MAKKKKINKPYDIDKDKGISAARIGDEKRFYCPRCDSFHKVTIGFYVPRHDCGRQMRPAWEKGFKREPD